MQARNTADLLAALTRRTEEDLAIARSFLALDPATLHLRPRPNAWNALECLAHLNHYGAYYLPEIRRQMAATRHRGAVATFTSSWLGNKFAAGMKPGPEMRKISTFRSANPQNFTEAAGLPAVTEFIRQQEDLLELLRMAAQVDLTKTKTGISISRLIRLRLGDTLRVVVYHNWRHILQAQAAIAG